VCHKVISASQEKIKEKHPISEKIPGNKLFWKCQMPHLFLANKYSYCFPFCFPPKEKAFVSENRTDAPRFAPTRLSDKYTQGASIYA
jgi:hypothetical protein